MTDFDDARSEFKQAYIDSSMWLPIRVTSQDSPPVVMETYAGYRQPTDIVYGQENTQSYRIEFVESDLPNLAEGDTVEFLDSSGNVITAMRFKVRESPFVQNDLLAHGDGFFKRCLLTKL